MAGSEDNSYNPGVTPPNQSGSSSVSTGSSSGGGGGFLNSLGKLAGAAPDIVQNTVSGLANSGRYGESTGANIPLAPEATGAAETGAANLIPGSIGAAGTGLEQAAQTEKGLVAPVGASVVSAAQQTQQRGLQQQQAAIDQFRNSVQSVNQKAYDVEKSLQDVSEAAKIDPQAYMKNMGIGQKTLTIIGLALSGIGSGLTGQPNLAMKSMQDNIDRDIAAQKTILQNKMEVAAQQKGLLQTAQDRQNLAQLALQQATIMVTTGANLAIDGVSAQVKGQVAPDLVNQMKLANQIKGAEALSNINTKYVQTVNSKNEKNVNQVGLGFDVAAQHMTDGTPLGLNKNPLQTAKEKAGANAIFNQNAQQGATAIPNYLQRPVETPKPVEAPKQTSKAPTQDFIEAMAAAKDMESQQRD